MAALSVATLVIAGALTALLSRPGWTSLNDAVGKNAPDFNLQDYNGKTVNLNDYQGKNVVLFFTEGVMCYPACWDQILALRNDARFNNDAVLQFSIVVDQKGDWANWMSQQPVLKTSVLFDTNKAVCRSYGVLTLPSSMHPGLMPGHTYFIVDKQGIIRYAFDDANMGVNNDKLANALSTLP